MTTDPMGGTAAAPARDAATIVLIRDGSAGIEVFMLVRHERLDFASGALVFPGGGVDPHDRAPALRERVPPALRDLEPGELALRVAAIREAYEECGVLLARPWGAGALVDGERLRRIDARYAEGRRRHELDLGQVAEEEALELACDLLVPFAHWITPATQPKRFDTHFYLTAAPLDHMAVHDGHESVESVWKEAATLCREADEGRWQVMFPTRMNLERVARSRTVAQALEAARRTPVVTVLPQLVERLEGGRRLRIPAEAGYGVSEVVVTSGGIVLPER
jgi:8-oxo-dGTP pyrophosphatase MutT (NUDIX family)